MNKNDNSRQDRAEQDPVTNDQATTNRAAHDRAGNDRDGLPPFVRSWKQLYQLLIGTLILLIVLFYLFMKHFQ